MSESAWWSFISSQSALSYVPSEATRTNGLPYSCRHRNSTLRNADQFLAVGPELLQKHLKVFSGNLCILSSLEEPSLVFHYLRIAKKNYRTTLLLPLLSHLLSALFLASVLIKTLIEVFCWYKQNSLPGTLIHYSKGIS